MSEGTIESNKIWRVFFLVNDEHVEDYDIFPGYWQEMGLAGRLVTRDVEAKVIGEAISKGVYQMEKRGFNNYDPIGCTLISTGTD